MMFTPWASTRKMAKLNSNRWFWYTPGKIARTTISGATMNSVCLRALGNTHPPSQQAARAQQQDEDQEHVRQKVGPRTEIGLYQHIADTVNHAAKRGAQGIAERAQHHDGE